MKLILATLMLFVLVGCTQYPEESGKGTVPPKGYQIQKNANGWYRWVANGYPSTSVFLKEKAAIENAWSDFHANNWQTVNDGSPQ